MKNKEIEVEKYFQNFKKDVDVVYDITSKARLKGFDPENIVESPIATSMAEKVVNLISTIYPQLKDSKITNRILELEKDYGKLNPTIIFKIAKEISLEKFCKFDNKIEAIDAGIRVGFSYITLGVVSSPIEGYTGINIGKTKNNEEYIIANFSGPIRSAGTTASCLVLILIDYLRELHGYSKYDPSSEEIKRVYSELYDFNQKVANLQYMPTEEECFFISKNLPIQISGDPSEKIEVSNYKNLKRINTNFIRSGVCLILGEGLAQKAAKGMRLFNIAQKNGIIGNGFSWLKEYVELHNKTTSGKVDTNDKPTYIKDLISGRPVYSHPSRSGGFRFRYGRGRNSGFSSVAVNPATMGVTDDFLAIGTQLKIEKPTKGCTVTVCDSIDGPIVKLFNGSVLKLNDIEYAKKIYGDIEEIIYLGDILFPFSDVLNRNSNLIKSGYVEEWWKLELENAGKKIEDCFNVDFDLAVKLSQKYNVALHPKFIYYWNEINKEEFLSLIKLLKKSKIKDSLVLDIEKKSKRALELLGVPHEVKNNKIIINKINSSALLYNIGFSDNFNIEFEKDVLTTINKYSKSVIKDKSGDFIGARMGRPEKAKLRKIPGGPNSLFVLGKSGGIRKTFSSSYEKGESFSQYPFYECLKCKEETIFKKCPKCNSETKIKYYSNDKKYKSFSNKNSVPYKYRAINIRDYFNLAKENLRIIDSEFPEVIKGIERTTSKNKISERIEKGILRAKHNLQVNKDGTIRVDATELPIVSFKPKEIGTSIKKLKELGYNKDINGNELIDENQIIEIMPHDVIIPNVVEDDKNIFVNICNFIDELLIKFYKMNPFYKIKSKNDLIGKIGVCMAPHNCAGVACRFIGFSNILSLMASPFMHAAIRRDCDGDEASIMILGDVLLNFSKSFLPNHRGGTQDAPLVMNVKIDAGEVDDQILDFECVNNYPLELYTKSQERVHSSLVKVKDIKEILKENKNPFVNLGYTHKTDNFNSGVNCSSYKTLPDMQTKLNHQMKLVEKIRAADTKDTARLIVETHFLKDIKGNLKKFSSQNFRCLECGEIIRRIPISGKCSKCSSNRLIFTINEGGIKKYMNPAIKLANDYNLSLYLKQTLKLTKEYIDSIFGKEEIKKEEIIK